MDDETWQQDIFARPDMTLMNDKNNEWMRVPLIKREIAQFAHLRTINLS